MNNLDILEERGVQTGRGRGDDTGGGGGEATADDLTGKDERASVGQINIGTVPKATLGDF